MSQAERAAERSPAAATCRRHAARGPLLAAAGWLAAAVAALAVAAVPYEIGESMCGVWGCFPPVPALVAMHLFWCVALAAGVHTVSGWRPGLLRPLGVVLILAAVAATALVVGNDLTRWLELPDQYRHYWPRRFGYVLATTTDIPLVQSLVTGVACLTLARRPLKNELAVSSNGRSSRLYCDSPPAAPAHSHDDGPRV